MSKDTVGSRWMDEFDPDIQPVLQCDVELNIESGNTFREVLATAAWALRNLAAQIETGWLDDGAHPVTAANGEQVGQVYLDHSGVSPRPE